MPVQLVLLVLWPYAGLVLTDLQIQLDVFSGSRTMLWQVWLVGAAVLCLLNMICAVRRKEQLVLAGMTAKLLLIPFYGISFFCGLILFAAAPPAVLIMVLLDGLYMLATSAYTLRGVYLAWRAGRMSAGWAIVLAISQCIFVLDVPGSIALYIYEKRRSR